MIKKNEFFDINKLPPKEGILLFPISMSRISNAQSATKCWEYMKIFSPSKVVKPLIGINFIYTDYLYFNSDEKAAKLKNKFMTLISSHKNEFLKTVSKNPMYIKKAFSFANWNQILLECKEFITFLGELNKIYNKDKAFQNYLREDVKRSGKKLDQNQLNFFLEEILVVYLLAKGKIRLQNDYVQDHEKWILWCYPGKPLKSEIYLYQKNFFKLHNKENDYENSYYDLEGQKLYNYDNVDLKRLAL